MGGRGRDGWWHVKHLPPPSSTRILPGGGHTGLQPPSSSTGWQCLPSGWVTPAHLPGRQQAPQPGAGGGGGRQQPYQRCSRLRWGVLQRALGWVRERSQTPLGTGKLSSHLGGHQPAPGPTQPSWPPALTLLCQGLAHSHPLRWEGPCLWSRLPWPAQQQQSSLWPPSSPTPPTFSVAGGGGRAAPHTPALGASCARGRLCWRSWRAAARLSPSPVSGSGPSWRRPRSFPGVRVGGTRARWSATYTKPKPGAPPFGSSSKASFLFP